MSMTAIRQSSKTAKPNAPATGVSPHIESAPPYLQGCGYTPGSTGFLVLGPGGFKS